MDQNYNNSQNDFLWTLLANPADDAYQYNYNLQRLVNDFPQSGILQALLAHSSEEKNLRQASVYFNARSLYKLINAPSSFIGVSDEKIIVQNGSRPVSFNGHLHQDTDASNAENYFSDNTPAETATPTEEHPVTEPEITPTAVDGQHFTDAATEVEHAIHDEAHTTNPVVEQPADALHEHQPVDDIPVIEEPVNIIEEAPAEFVAEPNEIAAEHTATHETHENAVLETENEIVNDTPVAEPIINYAFGLGNRMPPDPELTDEMPPVPLPAEEHADMHTADHGVPPDVSYEHSVEENIVDAHLPPPVPAEALVQPHPADAEMPPAVPAEHAADPVAAEYRGFEDAPSHEQSAEEHSPVAGYENEEPVQQYRPWDEPVSETQGPEVKEEAVEMQQPIEEYKPWEEAATTYHQPEFEEEHIETPAHAEEHEETATAHHQAEVKEEHIEIPSQAEEHSSWETAATEIHHTEANADSHTIEDETFDEITGNIDIEQDIVSNIAATDFFGFDRAFGEHKEPERVSQDTTAEPVNEQPGDADQQDLSKYHDEKMPYSFLWWLDKTRKEHSGVYQPYAPSAKEKESTNERTARSKPGTDELQQQYYENIFHITSVEELDKSVPQPPYAAPAFSEKKKEQQIIERFIQEEPQIRPQSSDKLDNENKAKKSSEDRDELVSETLAAIYSDQMLYHKAIASYKKLMLKFPEKSRYFAAKIEQLEKKTN